MNEEVMVDSASAPPDDPSLVQSVRRADELGGLLLTFISEYIKDCPDPLDFLDVLEALGKTGVRVMYQAGVVHPQPMFTEEMFKDICDMVSEPVINMLMESPFPPAQQMIGLVSSLAHLAKLHNDKIKEYLNSLEIDITKSNTQ